MWIGVLWAGLRVAMWITHVGGKFATWPAKKSINLDAQITNRNRNDIKSQQKEIAERQRNRNPNRL